MDSTVPPAPRSASPLNTLRRLPWPLLAVVAMLLSGCAVVGVLQGAWYGVGWLAALAVLAGCAPRYSSESAFFKYNYKATFDISSILQTNGGDGTQGFAMLPGAYVQGFGYSVTVGDFNGDGFADIAVGAPYAHPYFGSNYQQGAVTLVFGHKSAFPAQLDTYYTGTPSVARLWGGNYSHAGASVAMIGSINGDSLKDLAFGMPSGSQGRIGIVFGQGGLASDTNLSTLWGTTATYLTGNGTGTGLGRSVTGADVNGDGLGDVITGAYAYVYGGGNVGRIYEGLGHAGWGNCANFNPGPQYNLIRGPNTVDQHLGSTLAGGGDLNGDGAQDLVIGAEGAYPQPAKVFALFGFSGASYLNGSITSYAYATLNEDNVYDKLGYSVAMGDVNGDGFADIIAGAPFADRYPGSVNYADYYTGRVAVVFGRNALAGTSLYVSSLNGTNGFVVVGENAYDEVGRAVAVGDINGDGIPDLVIGETYSYGGKVYVVFGRHNWPAVVHLSQMTSTEGIVMSSLPSLHYGTGAEILLAVGDVDGDGRNDIIISTPYNNSYSGQVMVVFNKALRK